RLPNRVQAYTINILGSILGIVLFTLASTFEFSPFWWYLPAAIGIAYLSAPRPFLWRSANPWFASLGVLLVALFLASLSSGTHTRPQDSLLRSVRESVQNLASGGNPTFPPDAKLLHTYWSPYYRVDYSPPPDREINVNLIGHQTMRGLDFPAPG